MQHCAICRQDAKGDTPGTTVPLCRPHRIAWTSSVFYAALLDASPVTTEQRNAYRARFVTTFLQEEAAPCP